MLAAATGLLAHDHHRAWCVLADAVGGGAKEVVAEIYESLDEGFDLPQLARKAQNQALFREVKERIAELAAPFEAASPTRHCCSSFEP